MIIKDELTNKDNIKMLILDIDGTLVRFTNLERLMEDVLRKMHIEKEDNTFSKYVNAVAKILKDSEKNISFDFETLCAYISRQKVLRDKNKVPAFLKNMIDNEVDYVESVEDAQEFLETAAQKKYIVCSTNWFLSSQESKLKRFGLDKYVSNIYTCEHNISKPSIHHFLHILNCEAIRPEEAIMIGDSKTDLPEKSLKLQSILFDPNHSKESIYDNADCVVTRLSDINKVLGFHKDKEKTKNFT